MYTCFTGFDVQVKKPNPAKPEAPFTVHETHLHVKLGDPSNVRLDGLIVLIHMSTALPRYNYLQEMNSLSLWSTSIKWDQNNTRRGNCRYLNTKNIEIARHKLRDQIGFLIKVLSVNLHANNV